MTCSHCVGAGRLFNRKRAARDLKRYRKSGPSKTTSWLLDHLLAHGVEGQTLLDIGGGVGAIQHALIEDGGVVQATAVDASPAYVEVATEEARRRGHEGLVRHQVGDFVDHADGVGEADIVTLDRVVCCYPAMEELVRLSAERARRLYALVFPRDEWWIRALLAVPNLFLRATRNPFRVFVHPHDEVERVIQEQGLRRRFARTTPFWRVAVYERAS
jgi:magnesium-protoporphyrin O-methyltransferase